MLAIDRVAYTFASAESMPSHISGSLPEPPYVLLIPKSSDVIMLGHSAPLFFADQCLGIDP